MNKKMMVPLVVVGVILLAAAFGVYKIVGFLRPTQDESKKSKVAEAVNVIEVANRPYVQIAPLADGHNILLIVKEVKKTAQKAEYELEYQSGTLLQGAFGFLDLASVPSQEQVLLGSCSAGGKCSFHEDVQGGKLLLRFLDGDDKYVLRTDWRYLENKEKATQVSSKDAKFQLESDVLGKQAYVVVYNTPGYPSSLVGTPVSDTYSLAVSSTLSGKGTLSIRASEAQEGDVLVLQGYDGKQWHTFEGKTEDKTVTAEVDLMELYVVTK